MRVLCALGFKVHSIERQKRSSTRQRPLLKAMGWKPFLYYGDGYKGKPVFAPFDGIIITCARHDVPQALLGQLKVGGRMVIPVGDGDTQRMWTIDRISEREFTKKDHGYAAFVPMLEARARTDPRRALNCIPQIKSTGPKPSRMTSMSGPAAIQHGGGFKLTNASIDHEVHEVAVPFANQFGIGCDSINSSSSCTLLTTSGERVLEASAAQQVVWDPDADGFLFALAKFGHFSTRRQHKRVRSRQESLHSF